MSRRNFGNVPQRRHTSRFGRMHLVDSNGEEHNGGHFYHHGYHDPNMCPTCIRERQRVQARRNKKPCNCR